jgi:hypothetical protein
MRIRTATVLTAIAPIVVFGLIGWVFHLHGIQGLLHVEILFRVALLLASALAISPAALMLTGHVIRKKPNVRSRLQTPIITLASAGIVLALGGFGYLAGFPWSPAGDTSPRLIVAAGSGTNGLPDVAVVADSRATARYSLTWGNANTRTTLEEDRPSRQHVFILRELRPAAEYWYQINDGTKYRFSTPGDASRPLHFAVGSDAHFGASDSRNDLTAKMLAQIASPTNHFNYFFSLGDNVEFGFRPEQWAKAQAGFSAMLPVIPSIFAAGNHDTLFTGLGRYLNYCYPAGTQYCSGTRLWHRFDVGKVHFIVLDLEWSAETFTPEQAAWLEQELRSIPADDWTIVMNHGFYYGSGSVVRGWKWYDNPDTINRIAPLFEKYGVDLVFSGHDHQMELLEKSGVTYVIAGAFGGLPDAPRTYASPASLWYRASDYGYVDVSVDDTSIAITFRRADGTDLKTAALHKSPQR